MKLIVFKRDLEHKEKAKPKEYRKDDFYLFASDFVIASVFERLRFLKFLSVAEWRRAVDSNVIEKFLTDNNIDSIKIGYSWKVNLVRNTQQELTLLSFDFADKESTMLFALEYM